MSKGKVLVAMSGGVDSSVAALLLQQQGYEVAGAIMRLWSADDQSRSAESPTAVQNAEQVANQLGIPFQVFDFRAEFSERVMDYFACAYLRGDTPNPCVVCNRQLKFGLFLERASALGMDYMATGHYVRRVVEDGHCYLEQARDIGKDQTYALYGLRPEQLRRALFPLGELSKAEVRQLARDWQVPTANQAESQEICFIPDNDYRSWLNQRTGTMPPPGDIVLADGRVIGRHHGLRNYTIGQRRGLGLTWPEPLYVIELRPEANQVVVGVAAETGSDRLIACDCNLQYWPWSVEAVDLTARIRYHAQPVPCQAQLLPEQRLQVTFRQPVRAVTPGQAVVLYAGPRVVGGGTIMRQTD